MSYKHARTLSIYSADYVRSIEERLLDKVSKQENCWLFTGAGDGQGYGKLGVGTGQLRAHVVSYLLYTGDLPSHVDVAHSCNVKRCVQPQHLSQLSRSLNVQHAIRDGLQKCRLTDAQVLEIHEYLGRGYSQRSLADFYGVDQQIISRINRREAFKWVTSPTTTLQMQGGY